MTRHRYFKSRKCFQVIITRNSCTRRHHQTRYNDLHSSNRTTRRDPDDSMQWTRINHRHSYKQIDCRTHSMSVDTCISRLNICRYQTYAWTTNTGENNGMERAWHRWDRWGEQGIPPWRQQRRPNVSALPTWEFAVGGENGAWLLTAIDRRSGWVPKFVENGCYETETKSSGGDGASRRLLWQE